MILDTRNQIVKWALWAAENQRTKKDWFYEEIRPFGLTKSGPFHLDCSATCIWAYWMAGAHDPSGNNFNGWGNSVNLWYEGKHITQAQAKVGDIITFGPEGDVHAVLIVQIAPNPLCMSNGKVGDPSLVRLSVLESLGEVTFLRFPTRNRRLPLLSFRG